MCYQLADSAAIRRFRVSAASGPGFPPVRYSNASCHSQRLAASGGIRSSVQASCHLAAALRTRMSERNMHPL